MILRWTRTSRIHMREPKNPNAAVCGLPIPTAYQEDVRLIDETWDEMKTDQGCGLCRRRMLAQRLLPPVDEGTKP